MPLRVETVPNLVKGYASKDHAEKDALILELVVALRRVREEIIDLKEAYGNEEYDSEHCLQDAHKSYGFFTVTEEKFEAVLGPFQETK